MKRWIRFSAILGAVCLSAGLAAPVEAGIIPWTYNAIFGPVGSNAGYGYTTGYRGACCSGGVMGNSYLGPGYAFDPYGPAVGMGGGCNSCGTGGCGPGGCGVRSYYGPSCCSPCGFACGLGGCGIGGCGLGGCSTGSCGAGGCASGQCDTGLPANSSQGFGPAPESPNGPPPRPQTYANPPNPAGGNYGPNPETPASTIPGKSKEPAPAEPMPEASKDNSDSGFPGPAFGLDNKVTWRPAVQHERMELRPRYTSAKVARRTVYPKSNWVELPERHEEIAKK